MPEDAPPEPTAPPDGLSLRSVRPSDAEALAELMSLPGFRWGTARLPFETSEEIRARLERGVPGGRGLVAIVDGQVVGNATLERLVGRRAHIGRVGMGVHDAWVGRRIGTTLMAALIDLADRWLDLRRLELDVNVDNEAALALYRRFGFVIEGRERGHVFRDGAYVDGYVMARFNLL